MTKIDKYDNSIEQESISDIEIFIPISDTLIPYIYYCKITPNQITIFFQAKALKKILTIQNKNAKSI